MSTAVIVNALRTTAVTDALDHRAHIAPVRARSGQSSIATTKR